MGQTLQVPGYVELYSVQTLLDKRREVLIQARALPPGPDRNQFRQIAIALREICNEQWQKYNILGGFRSARPS